MKKIKHKIQKYTCDNNNRYNNNDNNNNNNITTTTTMTDYDYDYNYDYDYYSFCLTCQFIQRLLHVWPWVAQRRTFGIVATRLLQPRCSSCHTASSVKALKERVTSTTVCCCVSSQRHINLQTCNCKGQVPSLSYV